MRSFVFIHIPASNVLFNIFFLSPPRHVPRSTGSVGDSGSKSQYWAADAMPAQFTLLSALHPLTVLPDCVISPKDNSTPPYPAS